MYEPSKYSLFIIGSLGATPSQCYHNHQKPTSEQDPTRNISLPTVFAGLLAVLPLQKPSKNPKHEFFSSSQNQWKSLPAPAPCPFPLLSHPPLPQFSCRILITLYTGGHESVAVGQNTTVDPHFSRASPLDRRDSLFICEKLFSFGKVGAATYFIFILKGK